MMCLSILLLVIVRKNKYYSRFSNTFKFDYNILYTGQAPLRIAIYNIILNIDIICYTNIHIPRYSTFFDSTICIPEYLKSGSF